MLHPGDTPATGAGEPAAGPAPSASGVTGLVKILPVQGKGGDALSIKQVLPQASALFPGVTVTQTTCSDGV